MSSAPRLSPAQEAVVRRWFPAVEVIADLSWGLTDTVVLHVRSAKGESIVKAGGPGTITSGGRSLRTSSGRHLGGRLAAARD